MIKNLRKRVVQALAIALVACIGLGVFTIQPAAASGTPVISAEPATLHATATNRDVTLTFDLAQNPGLALAAIDVTWDATLLTNVSIAGSSVALPFHNVQTIAATHLRVNYFSFDGDHTTNGELFTITATVAPNVPVGEIEIGIAIHVIGNQMDEFIFNATVSLGVITIVDAPIWGDVRGLGTRPTMEDVMLLLNWVTGVTTIPLPNPEAANWHGLGVANTNLTHVMQLLNYVTDVAPLPVAN